MVLGLDSGNDVSDFADAEAGTDPPLEDANVDAKTLDAGAKPVDSGSDALVCAPGTGNCDGDPKNGCEQMLNDPHHCGGCTTVCGVTQVCGPTEECCVNNNMFCLKDTDCCSGKCNNTKCAGP